MHAYHGKDERRIPLILGHEVSGKIKMVNSKIKMLY